MNQQFNMDVMLHITGESPNPEILKSHIELFIKDAVIPLLNELKTANEALTVKLSAKVDKEK